MTFFYLLQKRLVARVCIKRFFDIERMQAFLYRCNGWCL